MPQIVNRGDGIAEVKHLRLIKDKPEEISPELFQELNRIWEVLRDRGVELILEPRAKIRDKEN